MKNNFLIVTLIPTLILTLPFMLSSSIALAEINMKDASYKNSFSDFPDIHRTYSSRSLHSGLFGFGWCSNLEKSLDIRSTKEIVAKDCDQESPFVLKEENNLLKTRVFQNKITKDKILFKAGIYTYRLLSGETRVFNRNGQLFSVISSDGSTLGLTYKKNYISEIKSELFSLQLYLNKKGQVTKIESNDGTHALYFYQQENLIQSIDSKNKSFNYEYDTLNNMIRLTYPDKTEENIVYNNDYDRVIKLELRNQCVEYFDFYSNLNDPLYQVSTLTRKCGGKILYHHIYEFWYKYRSDGLKYLERYKINQKSQTLDITYHPFIGNPIRILKNGKDLLTKI